MGLRGMSYNDTQPSVEDPSEFSGKRIGILVSHCFEEVELSFPYIYFTDRGAKVEVVGPWWVTNATIAAYEFVRATNYYRRDQTFQSAMDISYDALLVAGGVWSSTVVRNDADAIKLLQKQFTDKTKVVATVCSGSTVLINAGLARGRELTGSPSIAIDLTNAGATYLDVPAHMDFDTGGAILVTGRSPQGQDSQHFSAMVAAGLRAASQRKLTLE